MAAQSPEHAHATDCPDTSTFPTRPTHTTIGRQQDRRPVVSKQPLHSSDATKMSQHIRIGPESVLTAHVRSPTAAGSHSLAGADSAPHSEQNFSDVHARVLKVDSEPVHAAVAGHVLLYGIQELLRVVEGLRAQGQETPDRAGRRALEDAHFIKPVMCHPRASTYIKKTTWPRQAQSCPCCRARSRSPP